MKILFTILLLFFVLNGYSQQLTIDDLKTMDTLVGQKLKSYLLKKGYTIINNEISKDGLIKTIAYGFGGQSKDINQALLSGKRIVNVIEQKSNGKWDAMLFYSTPDESEFTAMKKYCVENKFSLVWSPTLNNQIRESYEYEAGSKIIMVDLVIDNSLPKKKTCYYISYSSAASN